MKRIIAVIMTLMMLMTCGIPCSAAEQTLAGTYVLDATALGMPMSVYLLIDENNNFHWTNKLENGADKGNGQIGEQDGLYMMLYSDSTADKLKTATFTLDGVNLLFSTKIPYGSSSFSPNTEDPDAVIYPYAQKVLYSEYQGEYVGALEVEAMGSTIVYYTALSLNNGAEYEMVTEFEMGGNLYNYVQTGSYSIENGNLVLTCEDREGQNGTIDENGITLNAFLSSMASSVREIRLRKATTAEVAGEYNGVKDLSAMGVMAYAKLTLDAIGGYTYMSQIAGEADYTEQGSFTVEGNQIVLQPEGGEPIECTLNNEVLDAKMRINESVPMTTAISFYSEAVNGVFTATGDDGYGNAISTVLTLNADGTYTIAVSVNGEVSYEEEGTFATEMSMTGVNLVLTAADGTVSTGVVSDTININHNIDNMFNVLGFKYSK